MPKVNFIGIDLTSSANKPSACVGLDKDLSLAFAGFLNSDLEIIDLVTSSAPYLIGIDAPLTLPLGLCCLEEGCPCKPKEARKGRSCERELAKLGIPCYFTTKKSIIKPMVYRGIRLRIELESKGFEVIEVYPYGTKVRLWGKAIPPKSTPAGLRFLQDHIAMVMPSFASQLERLNHDLCDAALAAYTTYLHYYGGTDLFGDPEEGVICVPEA